MRRRARLIAAAALTALALGALAGSAQALHLHIGDLVIEAEGAPTALPRRQNAPITLHGGGSILTASGELPPILKELTFLFDRHGAVDTTGLPICTRAKLAATDTAQARRNCPGAIVGEGRGTAIVKFPEQAPIKASSPITLFNGPPEHGDPTVLAHAYLSVPAPTTYIVPVVIETIHQGIYGYRTKATIPKIAGGYGVPISGRVKIGKKWTYKGRPHSYIAARCEDGKLQAKGEFTFTDGTRLEGLFFKPCMVRVERGPRLALERRPSFDAMTSPSRRAGARMNCGAMAKAEVRPCRNQTRSGVILGAGAERPFAHLTVTGQADSAGVAEP